MMVIKRKFVDFVWWETTKENQKEVRKISELFLIGFGFLILGFILQIIGNIYRT